MIVHCCREEYGYLKVRLYDRVPLLDRESGRRTVHQVVAYTEYPNYPDRNEIVLSTESQRIQQTVSRIKDTVESITRPDGTLVANKISGLINGANASLRAQYNEAERQDVLAILFENLDETSEMFGALAIGTQGILISKQRTEDGKDWVWTTAISYAGVIADTIVSGLISSKDGRVYIDLDKGESSATKLIGSSLIGDREVEAVIGQKNDDPNAYEGVVLNIDGETKIALNYPIEGLESILPAGLYVVTPEGKLGYIQFRDDGIIVSPPSDAITHISGNAEVSGELKVGKISASIASLTIDSVYTHVGGSLDVNGRLDVNGSFNATGGVKVGGYTKVNNALHVAEEISTDGELIAKGGAVITGDLNVDGNIGASGEKFRVVETSIGKVGINAYETAEPYFGDIGESQTDENGQARIDIDPLFAETVNTACPYQVFLQPYCDGYFYISERAEDHFIIKGPPNGAVGYEIKARQKGYENMRLKIIGEGER